MKAIQFTLPVYGEGVFSLLEDKKENFYSYYHQHDELQITYIVKGKGTVMVGNIVQSFHQGDVFILKPNEPHMFDKYGDDNTYTSDIHAIHVFINLNRMEKLFVIPEFDQVGTYLLDLETSKKLEYAYSKDLLSYFINLTEKSAIPKFAEFINLLHLLTLNQNNAVSLYSGAKRITYSDKDGERMSEVYKYTFDNFEKEISIEQVASLVHMTPSSFCKFFKKHTMKTYIGFLNEVRVEKACQMLINKKTESIAETAFLVGFNNIVHFNRIFKKITHISPRKYVKQHSI